MFQTFLHRRLRNATEYSNMLIVSLLWVFNKFYTLFVIGINLQFWDSVVTGGFEHFSLLNPYISLMKLKKDKHIWIEFANLKYTAKHFDEDINVVVKWKQLMMGEM